MLAGVAERWMPEVVPEADRLDEILVQAQGATDAARDAGRLERVGQTGPEVIALGIDEHLRLVTEPAERLGMDDPVAVALEGRSQPALVLRQVASAGLVGADRERRQPPLLVLTHEPGEGIGNATGGFRHQAANLVAGAD